ncbi:uncharacterized protein FPRO_05694 [Fusarium proliferatum ET1]|uniref:Uncharacterized protein n=1 Tax=Fusarium proliferatum (strain ET1) TaxID=1227346 RepID=A0A1L7VFJ3_FUSPR|nr:uncharacterized protein FPRO_05694 [Fusarium proliferatum ET1]CZR39114.1 uncharacterized protein FPRO_05694 [Fusarium proliferatum ET1]
MEEHHVYHHHHHHYHYHYTYPFPPGLPPNAPQNYEPVNQEAAGHNNEEPWAEDDDEEEEHSFVVFDDSFSILNLDALSPEAQARFTTIQSDEDDHQDGPPRKKARTSGCPARPKSQGESQHHSAVPQQSDNMTVIDQARIIYADGNFRVVNCDPAGPQVNIRWRVPGQRNLWLLRIPLSSMERSFGRILDLLRPEAPGDMPAFHTYAATPDDETVSMIISSSGKHNQNRFERGGGIAVPSGPGDVSALGRLLGFEVLGG